MKRRVRPLTIHTSRQPKPRAKSDKIKNLAAKDYETQVERLRRFWDAKPVIETGDLIGPALSPTKPTTPRPSLRRRIY